MKRGTLVVLLVGLATSVSTGESPLESRFSRERGSLTCFEGATSEQSCSGAGVTVYLRGDQICHLDWTIETSSQFIRRQYFFEGAFPRLVVETIHAKFDEHGEPLREPRYVSAKHYRLGPSETTARQKEFRDHVQLLMNDFRNNRQHFSRCLTKAANKPWAWNQWSSS